MKKTIAILLAVCLCIGLCACSVKSEQEPASKAIGLNKDNISQYLGYKIGKPVRKSSTSEYSIVTIEFYSLQGGSFGNTVVTLSFSDMYPDYIEEITGAELQSKDEYPRDGTITFTLPSDGRYEIDLEVWDWYGMGTVDFNLEFQNASGTFTPIS